jgi:hypothetical protein
VIHTRRHIRHEVHLGFSRVGVAKLEVERLCHYRLPTVDVVSSCKLDCEGRDV